MCLILIANDCLPEQRIVLLGNRDEFHPRASAAAMRWSDDVHVIGGRDLVAGGSWLAARDDGRFAVVTNLRTGIANTAPLSRGWLVRDFVLGSASPLEYLSALAGKVDRYGPFNLVVSDGVSVHAYDGSTRRHRLLQAGVHAISNGALTARWPKTERLLQLFEQATVTAPGDRAALLASLSDEQQPADNDLPDTGVSLELERMLAPIFIRGSGYGTRASSLLSVGTDGQLAFDEIRFGPDGIHAGSSHWRCHDMATGWQSAPTM